MAWRVINVEEQRKNFIKEYLENRFNITDICRRYQVSRKTGYKWIHRYSTNGEEGLHDLSKAPYSQPNKTRGEIVEQILTLKQEYGKWGPKKILGYLQDNQVFNELPSLNTVGNILARHGLVTPRKKRKRYPAKTDPLSHCENPNDVWCVDFKGWMLTKDEIKCAPLTLTDAFSRYILHCDNLLENKEKYVWEALNMAFCKYGLPIFIRHDNGPPFGTAGAGRLSKLSVKLIKAGIIPEWIEPGKPEQNGRHERMHLTLKNEGMTPGSLLSDQRKQFTEFVKYFNHTRPHEALGQIPPGRVYVPSSRLWNGKLINPEYTNGCIVKKVRDRGQVAWKSQDLYIGKALTNEYIGLKPSENGEHLVYFGPVFLGVINLDNEFVIPTRKARKKRNHIGNFY
jgi:transposase InsO family protein